ncbi:MAG: Prolyl-tRNA synthetase, partial [Massilibacillus sp.]|nr:Prolyl-tRNA synthetase [Massilibacillus sp.]
QMEIAEKIYAELRAAGVEAIIDDRKERAGVKFKDADLIGYPLRITVGPKTVNEDAIEVKVRRSGEAFVYTQAEYLEGVKQLLVNL